MGSYVHDGSFLLHLPTQRKINQYVLNCDKSGGYSSIVLSYCYDCIVCQCIDIKMALHVKSLFLEQEIINVFVVVAEDKSLPYQEQTFSLTVFHQFPMLLLNSKASCRRLVNIWREFLMVADKRGQAYWGIQFANSFLLQSWQKIFVFMCGLLGKLRKDFSIFSLIFHYLTYEEVFFVKAISWENRFCGKDILFTLKRIFFGNTFGVVLGKYNRNGQPLLIDTIKKFIVNKTNFDPGELHCIHIGSGGALIADFSNCIVRVPLSKDAKTSVEKNFYALEQLNKKILPYVTPEPLTCGIVNGLFIYCEHKLSGISLDLDKKASQRMDKRLIAHSFDVLTDSSIVVGELSSEENFRCLIEEPFWHISEFMSEQEQDILFAVLENVKIILMVVRIPLVITHGDFKKSNFIVNLKGSNIEIGLIDWEYMAIPGLPFCDLMRFMNHEINGWYDDNDNLMPLVWEFIHSENKNVLIEKYFKSLNIPISLLPTLTILFFIYHLNNYCRSNLDETISYKNKIISQKFMSVMKQYLELQQLFYETI